MNLFPSSLFTWDKKQKIAVVNLSDMNGRGYSLLIYRTVRIRSSKTGKVKPLTFSKVDYADPSHEDIAAWRYSSIINGEPWEIIFIND
jgi:hypothetical protein